MDAFVKRSGKKKSGREETKGAGGNGFGISSSEVTIKTNLKAFRKSSPNRSVSSDEDHADMEVDEPSGKKKYQPWVEK